VAFFAILSVLFWVGLYGHLMGGYGYLLEYTGIGLLGFAISLNFIMIAGFVSEVIGP